MRKLIVTDISEYSERFGANRWLISSFVVHCCQNEIHLDEIRKLRKSTQEQAIRVSSLNKLLDERSERIRQLEAERYSSSSSSALPSAAGGLAGVHAHPAGGSDMGEVERLRSRHQELLARVLELERQLNEKVHCMGFVRHWEVRLFAVSK